MSSERRVAKNKSSSSGKQLRGFVMRGLELRSSINLRVVDGVDAAIGEGCWWGRWFGMDIYAGKDWIVI